MLYVDYEKMWEVIRKQEKELFKLINDRDELFNITQPKATTFDKEKVDSSHSNNNVMESYVIKQEQYTTRINQLNQSIDDRYQALNRKREELRRSKHIDDRIYYLRYVERLNVFKIGIQVGYEKTQVYRRLKKIAKKCNMQ